MRIDKKEDTKIIQIISHCATSTGGGYVSNYHIYGLGEDSKVYELNTHTNEWYLEVSEKRES